MPVVAIGLNHRSAPLDLLERVAVSADRVPKLLADLCDGEVVSGAVVVATCHRLECYLDAERFHDTLHHVRDTLAVHTDTGSTVLADHLVAYFDGEAIDHLFTVSAGLDSAVLGEHEILGQVRVSWERSQAEGVVTPALSLLFRRAVEVGKRVRTETGLARGTASISHAAVELAAESVGDLAGRRVLVLGAGAMGSGIATASVGAEAGSVVVVNRSAERAERLCAELGPRAVPAPWDALDRELVAADVVICSTGATEPVLERSRFETLLPRRAGRPLVLVDVAMPRDVDPAVRGMDGVVVADLDDLRARAERGLDERRHAVVAAEAIVSSAVTRYADERAARLADPVITALRGAAEDLRRSELERYEARLAHLSAGDRDAVDALTRTLLAKLLHGPTVALRDAAGGSRGNRLADAVSELFGLES